MKVSTKYCRNIQSGSYAIPLGLEAEQVDFFYSMKRGDNGVLALRHWRDGHGGEDYPGTWRFLLKVIGDSIGPNRAADLKNKVFNNSKWTQQVSFQKMCAIFPLSTDSLFAPPPLLTACLPLPPTINLIAPFPLLTACLPLPIY